MFKAMVCLLRVSDISPQDNDELDIVMSFHNNTFGRETQFGNIFAHILLLHFLVVI